MSTPLKIPWRLRPPLLAAVIVAAFVSPSVTSTLPASPATGTITVSFLYMPPSQIEPSYHTAIWLEDSSGALVKTLFVSHDLSSTEFKMGEACPDWIKQSHWETAPRSQVDAVTGPTPHVGSGLFSFDVAQIGIPAGTYRFKFQVHITENYNVLHTGELTIGTSPHTARLEVLYSPSKPPGATDFVRDVRAEFSPSR